MIAIKIPTVSYEYENDKLILKNEEITVNVDTSFKAHLKWETHFQEAKKGVDLSSMIAVVSEWIKDDKTATKHLTDLLRVLYCFISSPKLPNFEDFVGILDTSNIETVIGKISAVIQEVGKFASKN
jgi:hypothetical protein